MAEIKHFKVVASLPSLLEPDSIYYVRVGQGYDQYVTNGVGVVVAHEANSKLGLESKVDKESGKQLSDENYTLDEKNKLEGVAVEATKNDTDAQLRDRATHTGVQPISSVEGLQDGLDEKVDKANNLSDLTNKVTARDNLGLGNVDNTSDLNKPISTATQAAIDVINTSLNSKTNTSTQVIAGTGLSGGGTLASNRTFDVVYGDTSGTAAQGNDSRIIGAMQKSANLADVDSAETARNNLGLGTNGSGNRTVSTDDPSGGVDGDIWLKVD